MEEITRSDSPTAILEQTTKQPNPFILAVLLTSILYFGVRPTQSSRTVPASRPIQTTINVSDPVANAVLQDASKRSGLPASQLRIVQVKPLTWLDRCSDGGRSTVLCKASPVPGWHITVASGSQRWFYRTHGSGSIYKL